jgi:glutamate N-acetyltransferase/amino-acid N-acetyltransferase
LLDGLKDAQEMSRLGPGGNALVMSTGVIGQSLQMDKIRNGIKTLLSESLPAPSSSFKNITHLSDSHESWLAAARGIMTTDTL